MGGGRGRLLEAADQNDSKTLYIMLGGAGTDWFQKQHYGTNKKQEQQGAPH